MKFKKYCLVVIIWSLSVNYVHAVQYSYDDLNRLTKAEYESGIVVEYEYDHAGNILKVTTYDKKSGKPIEDIKPDNGGENPGGDTKPDNGGANPGGDTKPGNGGSGGGQSATGGGAVNNSGTSGSGNTAEKGKEDSNVENKLILGIPSLILKLNGDNYTLNGEDYPIDAKIFISKNSRLMVPVRYIAYALNILPDKIKWDEKSKRVTIEGSPTIILSINEDYMLVDGIKVQLNEKAQVINGRIFLPIGDISRAFHIRYSWDNTSKQLSLFNK